MICIVRLAGFGFAGRSQSHTTARARWGEAATDQGVEETEVGAPRRCVHLAQNFQHYFLELQNGGWSPAHPIAG